MRRSDMGQHLTNQLLQYYQIKQDHSSNYLIIKVSISQRLEFNRHSSLRLEIKREQCHKRAL
jgi:hypothetical protein